MEIIYTQQWFLKHLLMKIFCLCVGLSPASERHIPESAKHLILTIHASSSIGFV